MDMTFGMPLKLKESLATSDAHFERNAHIAWKQRFGDKTVYLLGWCDSAYAVVDRLGSYNFEFISGTPDQLFCTP